MAATHKASLQLVKGAVYSVPAGKLAELADGPDVESHRTARCREA